MTQVIIVINWLQALSAKWSKKKVGREKRRECFRDFLLLFFYSSIRRRGWLISRATLRAKRAHNFQGLTAAATTTTAAPAPRTINSNIWWEWACLICMQRERANERRRDLTARLLKIFEHLLFSLVCFFFLWRTSIQARTCVRVCVRPLLTYDEVIQFEITGTHARMHTMSSDWAC